VKTKESKKPAIGRVPGFGTQIELVLGSALWAAGVRYRKQYRKIPGRPDFVVPKAKLAIFCDSSFWHGRGWPASSAQFRTNREFWLPKIERNIRRDEEVNGLLAGLGWTTLRFWDDEILKRTNECVTRVLDAIQKGTPRHDDTNSSD
jgi:DNA mismatch endonuclease (patch repair protein)